MLSRLIRLSGFIIAACILSAQNLGAQERGNERGLNTSSAVTASVGTRRALVVGISRYANLPASQQLEYADDDAEMVYAFLRSESGGPTLQAVLLRDEEATAARIISALTRLREDAVAGDEIIFYFAGHGDVERIAERTQRGRLLAYDAPPAQNYVGNGGTIPIVALRDIMNEIVQKGAQVIILTDACRAGSVNTSLSDGAQMTSAVLASDWSRVFRFVSSGANQLSEEDPDLGHGVFTYYLLDGLLGAADGEVDDVKDGQVDHSELQIYVLKKVRSNTQGQTPVVTGDPHRALSTVSAEVTWESLESLVPPRTVAIEYRVHGGLDSEQRSAEFAESLTPEQVELVEGFETALQSDSLTSEGGAVDSFEKLRGRIPPSYFEEFGDLLATALEDQVQESFSTFLNDDLLTSADNASTLLSLPSEDISAAADALDHAIALRGATYMSYPSLRSRAQFLRGWAEMLNRNYEEAAELLEAVNPPSAFALDALGYTYYQLDKTEEAAEALARAVELAPNWSEPRRLQGFVAQYEGEWEQALEFYSAAAALAPGNATLQVDLGEVHAQSGDMTLAMEAWRRGLDIDAEKVAANIARFITDRLRIADREELAEQIYAEALVRDPENASLISDRADFYRVSGRFDEAEADFRRALRFDGDYDAAWNGLGLMYEQLERYDEAAEAYAKTAELAPDSPVPFRNLGDVYTAQERYEEAIRNFELAAEKDSDYSAAHLGLGRVYERLENYDAAEEHYRLYAEMENSPNAYNTLGVFYETTTLEYEQAVKAYEQASDLGATALILSNLGDANRKLGRYYMSAGAYDAATLLDPCQPIALEGLDLLEDHGTVVPRDRACEVIEGRLVPGGPTLPDESLYVKHTLSGLAGEVWTVLLRSDAFDPFLLVHEETAEGSVELDRDDDSGEGVNAVIRFTLPRDGQFSIVANTYEAGGYGSYEVALMRSRPEGSATAANLGGGQVFQGELNAGSEIMDDGSSYAVHEIEAAAGEQLSLTLASAAFDSYLIVFDDEGNVLAEDDDSAGGLNSRITMTAPADGNYVVVVNTVEANEQGPYTLTINRGSSSGSGAAASFGDGQVFEGELTTASDTMADNTRYEVHMIEAQAGEALNVTLASAAFDTYLFVFTEDGDVLAEDDDSAGGTNSNLVLTAPADGTYLVVANCIGEDATGPYTLTVRRSQ